MWCLEAKAWKECQQVVANTSECVAGRESRVADPPDLPGERSSALVAWPIQSGRHDPPPNLAPTASSTLKPLKLMFPRFVSVPNMLRTRQTCGRGYLASSLILQ